MSAKAVIEIRDVIRVWIEFRAPKKGELTWTVSHDMDQKTTTCPEDKVKS